MTFGNLPRGAGLGRDSNRRKPGLIDYDFTLQHGTRAQRREVLRNLKLFARQGVPGAGEALEQAKVYFSKRAQRHWFVRPPGREGFHVVCTTPVTPAEILAQWPGAIVEARDD